MRARFWSPAPQQHSWWFLERPRRFLRSHVLRFRARYWLLLPALRLIGASTGAVGEEVVAFYDEEFARSTFSGQRRALSSRCGSVRPTRLRTSDAVSLQGGDDFLVGNAYPGFLLTLLTDFDRRPIHPG
jgi:hypothetical protein